jgi:membrane fusion protein (multidrug efflux system)
MFDETKEIRPSSTGQEVLAMIKRHPIVTISVIVLLVLGGVFFAYRSSQATASTTKPDKAAEKKEEKKLPVEISKAKKGSISSWILTTATLEPDSQVTIVSETNGTVEKLYVEEGSAVKEGQVIVQLAAKEKQVALQKANIRLQNAKMELDRKQKSYDQKIISQSEYDKAKFEMEVAESEKKSAEVDIDRITIRAPFTGIITERFIEKGQTIQPQTQLFALVDREPLKAKIYLPEKEIFGIQENQTVNLALNAQKDVQFQGRVRQINPAVDPKTGTVKVTVEVTKAPDAVRPGSFIDVKLVTQRHDNSILIPKKALVEEAGEKYVFLIANGTASRKNVEIGFMDDQNAEILKGVNTGDSVVIAGQGSLRDGIKTEVVSGR